MAHPRWVLSGLLLASVWPLLHAAAPVPASERKEAVQLAARIDHLIGARLASEKVAPAPLADDAEFLRRISLDLTGRIPTVAQVRAFLQDQRPDKRQRLVDEMLNSGAFLRHFTHVWRAILLPETKASDPNLAGAVETWLWQQVQANAPYDRMVRDLLRPGVVPAFAQAYENKPENLAAATSRIFLGLRVECAQCHDAKTEPWTREQFWGLAAFFAPSSGSGRRGQVVAGPGARSIRIPGTDKEVPARFLDGKEPKWSDALSPRSALAEWVTAPNNPYFARAAVNRLWAHFHGIGLVEPVDDLDEQNPASHPELLNELARQFTAHQFDLRFLVRAIVLSQTYQRTSRLTQPGQEDARLFARMAVRGLTAEQLFDSLAVATGFEEPQPARGQRMGKVRAAFLARFAHAGAQPTEFHLSILQALALMNGTLTAEATDLERSTTLAAVLDAPFMDNAGRVDTLYLATLGRKPRPEEAARMLKYVADGGADGRVEKAFADVFWVLLNSGEFILNH